MHSIPSQQAELVAGAGFWSYLSNPSPVTMSAARFIMSGQVDYAGLADEQGHYYNMVGA